MTRAVAFVSFSALLLCACNAANSGSAEPGGDASHGATSQSWICGREYENFAWGYQRRGVVLDGDGRVWRYEFKGTPASLPNPWHAKDLGALTEEELRQRYNGAVDTGKRVSADDIAQHMVLIHDAARASPTTPRNAGADMGTYMLYCFERNAAGATYRQVLIDQKGDFESTNPSSAAKALAAWLDGILK